jgi:hypothetical protein
MHHILKQNPLKPDNLKDFIKCSNPTNRHKRKETFYAERNPVYLLLYCITAICRSKKNLNYILKHLFIKYIITLG